MSRPAYPIPQHDPPRRRQRQTRAAQLDLIDTLLAGLDPAEARRLVGYVVKATERPRMRLTPLAALLVQRVEGGTL